MNQILREVCVVELVQLSGDIIMSIAKCGSNIKMKFLSKVMKGIVLK
jgi:hypothetical protein